MARSGIDLIVHGADDYRRQAHRLDVIANRKLKAKLKSEMVAVTKPTRVAIKQAVRAEMPKRGGLNRWAAVTPRSSTRFSGANAGVTIAMNKRGHDIASLNRGRLRHPLFGNRKHWFNQDVPSGWFRRTVEADAPRIQQQILDRVAEVIRDF